MFRNLNLIVAVIFIFIGVTLAQPEALRQDLDDAINAKPPIRENRQTDFNNLHIFFDNLQVKRNNTNLKDKELLIAFRDYFFSKKDCQQFDYHHDFLDQDFSSNEYCLSAPLRTAALGVYLAIAENQYLQTQLPLVKEYLNDQLDYIDDWNYQVGQFDEIAYLYYPSSYFQDYGMCQNQYATEQDPNPEECLAKKELAQLVESIYGDYRYRYWSMGLGSKGLAMARDMILLKIRNRENLEQENKDFIQANSNSQETYLQQCESGLPNKLYLVNTRINTRNGVKDNTESQREMVNEWIGKMNDHVDLLKDKTAQAESLAMQLENIELD